MHYLIPHEIILSSLFLKNIYLLTLFINPILMIYAEV